MHGFSVLIPSLIVLQSNVKCSSLFWTPRRVDIFEVTGYLLFVTDLTRLGVTRVVGGELGWCARQCWLTRVSMTARRAQPRTAVGEERGTGDHVLAPWMLRPACSRDE